MTDVLPIKRGDNIPSFRVIDMTNAACQNLSFVAGDAGTFTMVQVGGDTVVNAQPVVLDIGSNSLTYAWQPGDTDIAGEFRAKIKINFANGDVGSWPNDGYYYVRITDDLPIDYSITTTRVKDGFTTAASDDDIAGFIAVVSQADQCMTDNNVPGEIGQQLKVLAVRHMATNQRDGGSVTSERAVSGASRSYGAYKAGETGFLVTLQQLDRWGCVYGVVQNNQFMQLRSVGRRPERQSTY